MRFAGTVVLYNPEEDILENIQTYLPFIDCLYVMDNSTKTLDIIENVKQIDKVKYISLNGNKGIAKALKVATETAIDDGFDILLSMDQDSKFPTEDFAIIKNYLTTEDIANVGFVCINYLGNEELIAEGDKSSYIEVMSSITSGTFMVLDNYKKIPGYNEDLFIDLVDHDICCQLYEKDIKMICFNNIVLNHRLGEPEIQKFLWFKKKRLMHSPIRYYYMYRNYNYLKKNNSKKYRKVLNKRNSHYNLKSIFYRVFFTNVRRETYKMIMKGIKDGKKGILGEYSK